MKFDKKQFEVVWLRRMFVKLCSKNVCQWLQAKFSDRAEQLPSWHTCMLQMLHPYVHHLLVHKWHYSQMAHSAEIRSEEVCSWRLFSGNEVDTHLSADSVCVGPWNCPFVILVGSRKAAVNFLYLPSVPSGVTGMCCLCLHLAFCSVSCNKFSLLLKTYILQ